MSDISANKPLHWGLIGPGGIAEKFAQALAVVPDSQLFAVAGRNKNRAEAFARSYGASISYDDYHAMLENPQVDAVYIATPHRYHFEMARDALLAGKPVLCEKPLCVNVAETKALIDLSRSTGVFLMEALWTRFLPIYDDVAAWLEYGKIGKVHTVTSSFGLDNPSDRLLDPNLAGGALLDLGIYNVSMSQWVYRSEPVGHSIEGILGDSGVDEHSKTILSYSEERSSIFENSLRQPLENSFNIEGAAGSIRLEPAFCGATRATLTTLDSNTPLSVSREFRATGLEYQIEEVQRCIRMGLLQCPKISHQNTLDTMIVLDALRRDLGLSYAFEGVGI